MDGDVARDPVAVAQHAPTDLATSEAVATQEPVLNGYVSSSHFLPTAYISPCLHHVA